MKNLLAVILVVLLSLEVFAQKNQTQSVFKEIYESPAQVLSITQQSQLQKLQQSDNYLSVTVIKVEDLEQALRGETPTFDLPGILKRATAKTKSINYSTKNDFTWNGTFNKGEALLIHENGRTYGQIRKDGAVFDIQYLENGYAALIEYNMEKLNQDGCSVQDEPIAQSNSKSKEVDISVGITEEMSVDGNPFTTIRTLVLYTANASATGINMTDLANTAQAQWVTATGNSVVFPRLEIVGVEEVDFRENRLKSTLNGGINITSDVNLLRDDDTAKQLRDSFEADVVILFTNGNYPGVSGSVADVGPIDSTSYAIVQVASATSTMTFIHETAHLFGARHEFNVNEDDTPGDAHGHDWIKWFWPFRDFYRSIMRTYDKDRDRERVFNFSNPNINHLGKPTGVWGASYNARIINENGPILENFRYTQGDMAVSINGPSEADYGNVLFFTSSVANGTPPYTYQWQAKTIGQYFNVGSNSSTLTYIMPEDIDLQLLLTVTGADNEQAIGFQMVQNLFSGGDGGPCFNCADKTLFDTTIEQPKENEANINIDQVLVFPNPATNQLQVVLPDYATVNATIQIVDLSGAVVFDNTITEKQQLQTINVTKLKQGVYVLKVVSNSKIQSIKFIKE